MLNKVMSSEDSSAKSLFPVNTIEDVIVNEASNDLSEFLPSIQSSASGSIGAPFCGTEGNSMTISDELYNLLV